MVEGNTMLTAPSTATNHALVVLTDGKENQAQFINSVVLGSSVKTYAIGLGLPQEVNVDKLSAIAGNTGGYLLVTGALDAENEFRLHKYYAQILAGIHGESIVLDPRGVIAAGDVHRIPFFVTEGDSHFDVVLLAHSSLLRFSLEAPDGSRVDAGNVSSFNGLFVDGRACRYYRMTIPIFAGDPARALGRWHIVIDYPGKRRYQGALALRRAANVRPNDDRRKGFLLTVSTKVGIPYNVLVRARSSIQMDAQIEQRGFGPGLDRTVVAFVRAFGQPLSANLSLFAHVTRPDGITSLLPLKHQGDGRFEAQLADSKMLGHYSIVVRAAGQTPGNWPLQREQTLSGIVIDPAADNNENEITGILKDQQEALKDLAQRFKDLLLAFQSASQPPAPAKPDTFGKWLLWILIILILILLLIFWSILKQ
jgi:hypothetical protein